ncbi:MAG: DUF2267 domain-containing protein [Gammaproteobacteria bacterium]|nr:MAG: DUF2267 domain-containing protein [Gammaproteobacteria bacterium]
MSSTGLQVFDATLQKTMGWLKELERDNHCGDRHRAYTELRAVLHALRDRLLPEEAVKLGAQLPMLVRGFYYEGWHLNGKPLKYRHKEAFLQAVRQELPSDFPEEDLEEVVHNVFRVLNAHLSEGEIRHVRDELPEDIRQLWPEREAA